MGSGTKSQQMNKQIAHTIEERRKNGSKGEGNA